MVETSVRLLRLLSLLQVRRDWSGAELAERLEVTTRTVRNDVERLRIMGYRIGSTSGVAGGYRMGAGAVLPPLVLDDEEAVAVAAGLYGAAGGTVSGIEESAVRALAKLEQLLPARLRHRIEALRTAMVTVGGHGPTVDATVLTAIAVAVHGHERLRFDYVGRDGSATVRSVEPHQLVHTGHRWYLLAWDRDRDDWRTFRADRIRPRTPTGPRFTPRDPPDGGAAAHVVRGVGASGRRYAARIRLHVAAGTVAAHVPPEVGVLRPVDTGSCVLETGAESLHEVVAVVSRLGVAFTVEEPAELRDVLDALARRHRAGPAGH